MDTFDITPLVSMMEQHIAEAKAFRDNETDETNKPDLRTQAIGIFGKNGSIVFTAEDFKAYGLTAKESETVAALSAKIRNAYVAQWGEGSGSFDTKPGTAVLGSLKSLQDAGVLNVEQVATVDSLREEWRTSAPLRGLAALSDDERQAKAVARRAAKAKAAAESLAAEAS